MFSVLEETTEDNTMIETTENPQLAAYKYMALLLRQGRRYSAEFDDTDESIKVESYGLMSIRFKKG